MEKFVSPAKKRKLSHEPSEKRQCLVCKEYCRKSDNYKTYIFNQTLASLGNLIDKIKTRYENGELEVSELFREIQDLSAEDLFNRKVSYHKACYTTHVNKKLIERGEKRLVKAESSANINIIVNKSVGRPKKETPTQDDSRAIRHLFDKNLCLFCQEEKEEALHNVEYANMGTQFLQIGKQSRNDVVKKRLSLLVASDDPLDAVAYDMKYHLPCLVKNKRDCVTSSDENDAVDIPEGTKIRLIADLEIIEVVKLELSDERDKVLNMKEIQDAYLDILCGLNFCIPAKPNYKKYLKHLILENIEDVHFNKPKRKNEPEQIMSTRATQVAIENSIDSMKNDYGVITEAAKILRREICSMSRWKFQGRFDDFQIPLLVQTFCKSVLMGTRKIKTNERESEINKSSSILAQLIIQMTKTDKQVSYTPKKEKCQFNSHIETPLSVGIALDFHTYTRSEQLVSKLKDLGIGISYKKLLSIENALAAHVVDETKSNNGVYLPPWAISGEFAWYAIDNIDFLEHTPSGMNTLHGTAIAMYQQKAGNECPNERLFDRKRKLKEIYDDCEMPLLHCSDPKPKKNTRHDYPLLESVSTMDEKSKTDLAWIMATVECSNTDFDADGVQERINRTPGTWAAFNSLSSPPNENLTNIALLAPLIRSPPTDINTLFTAIRRTGEVTRQVMGEGKMTVITFDLQLYDLAMRLWEVNEEIRENYIFRAGELHVAFWALAALGKYIEASGIDQAWVEGGLYKTCTVTKILNGKQYYRALEAHMVTLVSFYQLYFNRFLHLYPEYEKLFIEISELLQKSYEQSVSSNGGNSLSESLSTAIQLYENCEFVNKLTEFERSFTKQQNFIMSYIRQFKTILLYIRATRERNFKLHLESTERLIKYFFAHDHLNYARLLPVYLSCMRKIERQHPEVWEQFLMGNFCVTKNEIPFTSIAPDHALEQENRRLKVHGGVIGITQNENALKRFFLIAPELKRLCVKFEESVGIHTFSHKTKHHEIQGTKLQRMNTNKARLQAIIVEHGDPFISTSTDMINLLTHAVVPEKVAGDIANRDNVGRELFKKFVEERLKMGTFSPWDPMKKRKLSTFAHCNTSLELKSGDKIVKLKEERGLLQRFIIAARSRPELDLKECISKYEFGVIPRSLFSSDGSLLLPRDKSKIMQGLEGLPSECTGTTSRNPDVNKRVILFDGMELVNSINKTCSIETCSHLAKAFITLLVSKSNGFDEAHLVFDVYHEVSLKAKMRKKRTQGVTTTYYHITDSTLIRHISLKELLSDVRTKGELCEYLAEKVLKFSKSSENKLGDFMVTFGNKTCGNMEVTDALKTHNHEEADTLLLLHSFLLDSSCGVVVQSPDTDVLVLLISLYKKLPPNILFRTGKGDKQREIDVGKLYHTLCERHASALLGFHAFTGCDVTGKFAGISKDFCFKTFLTCDDEILDALGSLGTDSFSNWDALERFVCALYKHTKYSKVGDLRWYLYSNRGAEAESLPPTKGALEIHIMRSHYISMIWKKSLENMMSLPAIEDFGWKKDEKGFIYPVRCNIPPAPESITNLIKCGCQTGCAKSCGCGRHKIACTELCKCSQSSCVNPFNKIFGEDAFDDGEDM